MAETDMAELGRQFKQLRRERRITLKEAAGAICSEATLSRFENGHSQLPADIFIALVERLHFDWRFFTVPDGAGNNDEFVYHLGAVIDRQSYLMLTAFVRATEQNIQDRPAKNRAEAFVAHLQLYCLYPDRTVLNQTVLQASIDYLFRMAHWNVIEYLLAQLTVRVCGRPGAERLSVIRSIVDHIFVEADNPNNSQQLVEQLQLVLAEVAVVYRRVGRYDDARRVLTMVKNVTVPSLYLDAVMNALKFSVEASAGDASAKEKVTGIVNFLLTIQAGAVADKLAYWYGVQDLLPNWPPAPSD